MGEAGKSTRLMSLAVARSFVMDFRFRWQAQEVLARALGQRPCALPSSVSL